MEASDFVTLTREQSLHCWRTCQTTGTHLIGVGARIWQNCCQCHLHEIRPSMSGGFETRLKHIHSTTLLHTWQDTFSSSNSTVCPAEMMHLIRASILGTALRNICKLWERLRRCWCQVTEVDSITSVLGWSPCRNFITWLENFVGPLTGLGRFERQRTNAQSELDWVRSLLTVSILSLAVIAPPPVRKSLYISCSLKIQCQHPATCRWLVHQNSMLK